MTLAVHMIVFFECGLVDFDVLASVLVGWEFGVLGGRCDTESRADTSRLWSNAEVLNEWFVIRDPWSFEVTRTCWNVGAFGFMDICVQKWHGWKAGSWITWADTWAGFRSGLGAEVPWKRCRESVTTCLVWETQRNIVNYKQGTMKKFLLRLGIKKSERIISPSSCPPCACRSLKGKYIRSRTFF